MAIEYCLNYTTRARAREHERENEQKFKSIIRRKENRTELLQRVEQNQKVSNTQLEPQVEKRKQTKGIFEGTWLRIFQSQLEITNPRNLTPRRINNDNDKKPQVNPKLQNTKDKGKIMT
jgi:hypothetical protein